MMRAAVRVERMTFQAAQIVIATNESYKKIAVERGGKAAGRCVHRALRLRPCRGSSCTRRSRRGRRANRISILYLGEICQQDGVEYLVRAVKALRDEFRRDDFHCILVGGGPHQPAVAACAERRRRRRSVHLHRHDQRRHPLVPDPVVGRCRGRAGAEKRLVRPQHRQQDRRIHVLRPADRLVRSDRGAGLGRRCGALRDPGRSAGDGRGNRRIARRSRRAARRWANSGSIGCATRSPSSISVPHLLAAYDAAWALTRRGRAGAAPLRPRIAGRRLAPASRARYSPAQGAEGCGGAMYEPFYGLFRPPFAVTPDPSLMYLSPAHREALATIIYGIETRKGFIVCTGEVGTGKTTVIRAFFDQARADAFKLIYVFTPQVSPLEMATHICGELGMDDPESVFTAVPRLQMKSAGDLRERPHRRADDRRGAIAAGRNAGIPAAAQQFRDRHREADPDRPGRPARARQSAGAARHAAGGATRRVARPAASFELRGRARIRRAPAAGKRRRRYRAR